MTKVETKDRRPHRRTELAPDAILAPFSEAGGVGPDLSQADDSPFDAIREARRQDDALPQGIWQSERKLADWDLVVALSQEVLVTRSKDLRLLVWLVEALVQRDGFAGLAPGFTLLEQFCRAFWVNLHPLMDDDGDLSARTNTIALLNNRVPLILNTVPITQSGYAEPIRLSWGDYETARLYQARGAAGPGGVTTSSFQDSAASTPVAQLEQLFEDVRAGLSAVDGLDAFLDQVCAREAPSLMAIKSQLSDIAGWLHATLPEAQPSEPEPEPEPLSAAEVGESVSMTPPAPTSGPRDAATGPITNRDDAYRRLAEVADYLMRVEPHSPAPYVLRRVLAWGRMPLHEVLLEMASGRNDLSAVLELIVSKE